MAIPGQEQLYNLIYDIFLFILIILVIAAIARISKILIDKTVKTSTPLIARIKQYVSLLIWTAGIIIGVRHVGIPVDILIPLIGIAGIGFILSAIYIFQNFVSRSFLNLQMQYKVGDVISIENFSGKVIEVTELNTILLGKDGRLIAVPNVKFIKEIWTKHRSVSAGYEMTIPVVISKEIDGVHFEKELLNSIQGLKSSFKKEPNIITSRTNEKTIELSLILNLNDPEKKSIISVEIDEIIKRLITEFAEKAEKEKKEAKIKEIKEISQ
jgi:small-conductance mechanosensitive channel